MNFADWWDTVGTRLYAETHEERARQAWEACLEDAHSFIYRQQVKEFSNISPIDDY